MPHTIYRSPPRARLLAVATLVSGVLVTGCAGGSPGPTTSAPSGASGSTTTAGSPTAAGGAPSSRSTEPSAGSGALAFAECMRANGVPNFPDPNPGGGFNLSAESAPSSPAFEAAQTKCQKLLPAGNLPVHASEKTLVKLLKIARCMRQHGVPQFPDPQTSVPSNSTPVRGREITDFDGAILVFPSTIDPEAPAYKQALTACGAPPLGLPH